MPPDTVLVTGAGGFVGSRVVERLASGGVRVRALVRRGRVAGSAAAAGCERVRGDVTDPASVARAAEGCRVIHHCAWGGQTLDEGRHVNVEGTANVIRAAAAAGIRRVVHLSTMSVHGQKLPPTLTEDAPLVLHGEPYGVTKAEGERTALALGARLGVEVVVLRPTIVYGPGAPLWLRLYLERTIREEIALIDGGSGIANLIYVDDLVDAMLAAATRPAVGGQAFLVSGATPVTWREYIGCFARMAGKPLPGSVSRWRARLEVQWLRVYGTLASRPRRLVGMDLSLMSTQSVVTTDKARRLLGWTPRVSLEEGMRRCEAWARAEGILPRRPDVVATSPEPVRAAAAT